MLVLDKQFNKLFWLLIFVIFIVVCLRAFFIPFSHDETATFFFYVQSNNYLPYNAHVYTNNHVLNSALTNICYHILGSHRFVLRIPNIIAFLLMCIGIFRLFKNLNTVSSKLILVTFFLLTYFMKIGTNLHWVTCARVFCRQQQEKSAWTRQMVPPEFIGRWRPIPGFNSVWSRTLTRFDWSMYDRHLHRHRFSRLSREGTPLLLWSELVLVCNHQQSLGDIYWRTALSARTVLASQMLCALERFLPSQLSEAVPIGRIGWT